MSIPGDVATASAEETWPREHPTYDFQQCTAPHIPRAWERAPKSSFAPQHKGRKVWKRYELRATEVDSTLHDRPQKRGGECEEGLRPIKRRRAKQAPEARDLANTQTPPRFFTTLREQPHGTPRRKVTKRTSLKGGKSIRQNRPTTDLQLVCKDEVTASDESLFGTPDKNESTLKVAPKTGSVLPIEDTGDNSLTPPPVIPGSEPAQRTLHATTDSSQRIQEPLTTKVSLGGVVSEDSDGRMVTVQGECGLMLYRKDDKSDHLVEAQRGEKASEEAVQPDTQRNPIKLCTPVEDEILKDRLRPSIDHLENAIVPIECDMSIETSNLGISAYRDNGHLLEVQELCTDACTPIVISDDNGPYDNDIEHLSGLTSKEVMSTRHPSEELSPPSANPECSKVLDTVTERTAGITGSEDNAAGRHSNVDKEGHMMQIISSAEDLEPQGVETESEIRVPGNVTTVQADIVPPPIVKEEVTQGRTRSGARFSDDTSMLKDFLNRAQARKAAVPKRRAESTRPVSVSPRRSPRKVLGHLDSNSPTPARARDLEKRLDTPLGKKVVENIETDEIGNELADPTSCRRSTRTRLPAPAKKSAGAPSFIPVRRVDGTDPVVLQKSVAQELAVVTRANTRRNKGESRPPKLTLPDIVVEAAESADVTRQTDNCTKMVSWDERLAYYQEAGETKEGKEETRPKVRRLRGLGAANGTPAAKKVVMDMAAPGPRRPGRSRG